MKFKTSRVASSAFASYRSLHSTIKLRSDTFPRLVASENHTQSTTLAHNGHELLQLVVHPS